MGFNSDAGASWQQRSQLDQQQKVGLAWSTARLTGGLGYGACCKGDLDTLAPNIGIITCTERKSQLMVTMLEIICYPTAQSSPLTSILGSDKHLTGKGTGLEFA